MMMRIFLGFICIIGLSHAFPANDYAYSTPNGNNAFSGLTLNAYTGNGGSPSTSAEYTRTTYEAPLISKHFYLHSAPEEEDNSPPKRFQLGRPQKNYRVVFIRAPTANKQRLAAEFAPNEDKTVIYVLAQKEHEIDPSDIATPAPTEPSKPEVFFIKYKTPEEAAHAQQQIQAQYDALGGSSQVSDEGYAPLSSVVGSLGGSGSPSGASPSGSLKAAAINSRYLPANKK